MGTLHDAVNWRQCPKPAALYVDGHVGVAPASAFVPGDVDISVWAGDHHMLDCEPGNASPEACAERAAAREHRGGHGDWTVIYCNAGDGSGWYQRVTARLHQLGTGWSRPETWATVAGGAPHIYWGAVEATGTPHRNPASIFTQYQEEAVGPQGQRFDLSVTLDPFPFPPDGVPLPAPPAPPAPPKPALPFTYGPPFGDPAMPARPFSLTTDASGHTEMEIPLPPGCTVIVGGTVDLASIYRRPAGPWDAPAHVNPAVMAANPKPGTANFQVVGAPNHFYTGHIIFS